MKKGFLKENSLTIKVFLLIIAEVFAVSYFKTYNCCLIVISLLICILLFGWIGFNKSNRKVYGGIVGDFIKWSEAKSWAGAFFSIVFIVNWGWMTTYLGRSILQEELNYLFLFEALVMMVSLLILIFIYKSEGLEVDCIDWRERAVLLMGYSIKDGDIRSFNSIGILKQCKRIKKILFVVDENVTSLDKNKFLAEVKKIEGYENGVEIEFTSPVDYDADVSEIFRCSNMFLCKIEEEYGPNNTIINCSPGTSLVTAALAILAMKKERALVYMKQDRSDEFAEIPIERDLFGNFIPELQKE